MEKPKPLPITGAKNKIDSGMDKILKELNAQRELLNQILANQKDMAKQIKRLEELAQDNGKLDRPLTLKQTKEALGGISKSKVYDLTKEGSIMTIGDGKWSAISVDKHNSRKASNIYNPEGGTPELTKK